MSLLSDLTPLNILSEKDKFFAQTDLNPQFIYKRNFSPGELTRSGLPEKNVADYCLDQLLQDNLQEPGVYIDQTFILKAIQQFNLDYQLDQPIQVQFSEHYATKCHVSSETIFFKIPIRYTVQTFRGLYRHELESHVLRRLNHLHNFGSKEVDDEYEYRSTEEGIANLHTHLFRRDKKIKKTFLSYYSVYLSQHFSFSQMFYELLKLGMTKERAWNLCLRNKRGLSDTSLPGGFTKDVCYLQGTILVWDWIVNQQNNPVNLYLGRLGLKTIDSIKDEQEKYTILQPHFLEKSEYYLAMIKKIGEVNAFSELKGIV